MKDKKLGTLAVLISAVIFGVNFVSMKYLLEVIPLFALIFLRFAIGTVFLSILLTVKTKGKEKIPYNRLAREDLKIVIITGFIGISLYYYLQTSSLKYITASLAALISATIPIFTLLTGAIIQKKKIEKFLIISFIFSLLGVYLVIDKSLLSLLNSKEIIGVIFMLLAVFSWIIFTVQTTGLQKKYNSLYLVKIQSLVGTIFLLLFAGKDLMVVVEVFKTTDEMMKLIINLAFVGIVGAALGYYFYIYGMEQVGVEVASLFLNLTPVVTAMGSYFIFDEVLNTKQIVGIVIVLISLYVVTYRDWLISRKLMMKKPTDYKPQSSVG